MNTIRIGAVQHIAELGKNEENRNKARPLIEEAAAKGAQLVALPEMAITGYSLNREIWAYSEQIDGPTEKWLKETAKKLNIYLCVGLLQHEDKDFYNTYLVVDPNGETVGRVRKTQTEFNIHRPGSLESHIVQTSLGKIGVGICADNHRTFFLDYIRHHDIDLMLQPHASPSPYKVGGLVSEQDIIDNEEKIKNFPGNYAELLGVPTVFINQTGHIGGKPWPGILGSLMDFNLLKYLGYSAIVEPGRIIARMGDEEGVIVSDVKLSKMKSDKPTPDYGGWVHPGSGVFRKIIMPIDITLGRISYSLRSGERTKLTRPYE